MDVKDIAPRMRFHFATGSKYFMEIAKLRAARYLWAHIVKAYNPCCDCVCKMNTMLKHQNGTRRYTIRT